MAKIRVYELAKKMGVPSAHLMDELKALGIEVASNFATLDEEDLEKLRGARKASAAKAPAKAAHEARPKADVPPAKAAAPHKAEAPKAAPATKGAAPAKPAVETPKKAPAPKAQEPHARATHPAPKPPAAAKAPVKAPEAPAKHVPVGSKVQPVPAKVPAAPTPASPPAPLGKAPPGPVEAKPSAAPAPPQAPTRPAPPMMHKPGTHGVPPRPATSPAAAGQAGAPAARPGQQPFPPRRPEFPRRPGYPPSRPGAPEQRGPRPGAPTAAPGAPARPAEAPRPAPRPLPPAARRKTKRERRMEKLQAKTDRRERLEAELEAAKAKAETGEAIFIREGITVKELADKLNLKVRDIIAKLMMRGILVTINQPLDGQVAVEVCSTFGYLAEIISYEDEIVLTQEEGPGEEKTPRAPVVTVMGHVDHGKSSLLEAIHDVDITSKEFGGITQHIGAYKVRHGEREYVFLDTPGHEAFTLMRARGAQVTDIVILVVAADDGVMPQTVEAINHCKAANVPMVVAINKMDKPGADPDRVKRSLSEHGVLAEDWGGEVVCVPVSAKSRQGIEELLEMVALVADMLVLKANETQHASGTVLESRLDRARGPVATVLIQEGALKVGDLFLCGTTYGHVRGMFDDKGVRIDKVGPSSPVEILGFSEVPAVGALFQGMDDEAKARQIASFRREQEKAKALRTGKVRLENVFGAIKQGEMQQLALIIKADVQGSLEAVSQKVSELTGEEVKIAIVHQGVGAISESDILLASASNALVIGFNVRPERKAVDLAKAEGVEIHLFTVIYDLIDRMKQALTGMLKPIEEEVVTGHAEVKQIFKVSKVGTVAGCLVSDGKIARASQVRVLRDNVVVHTGKLNALKRFKDDVSEVKDGTECGISLENYNDVKPGDVLEAFEIRIQERTL